MLETAKRVKRAGVDVAVGVVSCDQWPQTKALAEGLERLPCKAVACGGQTEYELDLDVCLRRQPQLLLLTTFLIEMWMIPATKKGTKILRSC